MTQSPVIRLDLDEATAKRVSDVLEDAFPFGEVSISAFETGPDAWRVEVYGSPEMEAAELASAMREALGPEATGLRLEQGAIDEHDWIAKSLEGLKPVPAGRFVIHGSHDRDKIPADVIAIEIEAALAFGTGHHGTTRGCLIAIDELLTERRFERVLDLGSGTGVLAIAIGLAQKSPVLATDIDETSARIAGENAAANGAGEFVTSIHAESFDHPVFSERGPFDLIVANILAGPLVQLAPDVKRHLAGGGRVVLSGLMNHEEDQVLAAYAAEGLAPVKKLRLEGWSTLVLQG
ncbi:50S ribosomal protein L11 methyltransferase [Chelatococcus sambhunathii]|uniref:Ribosomal protein L11 methyltransferase n=1 Tax=Chelatococcus sambhunathii TaxID=363953 RepID=A0ABU1DCB0_9HYPH|nr:50S ribosomal protein L11 methyltransferase [Chelatococcus sambhunathii]MDR4305555.1 50S ribosomal protein L11 methyltransferase [Chelatococcus sambhunathii]